MTQNPTAPGLDPSRNDYHDLHDVEPVCQRCETSGELDGYKGDDVSRCPDCETILFRKITP